MATPPPRPPPPPDTLRQHRSSYTQSPLGGHAADTPPPPPPKPGASHRNSGYGGGSTGGAEGAGVGNTVTPGASYTGYAAPPPPPGLPSSSDPSSHNHPPSSSAGGIDQEQHQQSGIPPPPSIEQGWLPDLVREQSKSDLESLLSSPSLLTSLLRASSTAHPSLLASDSQIQAALSQNQSLGAHVSAQAEATQQQRADVASRLVQLRALERQWHRKQTAMDDALAPFSPKALHARLVQGISEQEAVLLAMEESFVEAEGRAGERELAEFVKRWRDARKTLGLRRERKARFEEGRVGGWR